MYKFISDVPPKLRKNFDFVMFPPSMKEEKEVERWCANGSLGEHVRKGNYEEVQKCLGRIAMVPYTFACFDLMSLDPAHIIKFFKAYPTASIKFDGTGYAYDQTVTQKDDKIIVFED